MWEVITYLALVSCCAFAYMVPVVALIVWLRRWRDKTEIIQEDDWTITTDEEWLSPEG